VYINLNFDIIIFNFLKKLNINIMDSKINIIKASSNIIENVIHISDLHFTMKDKYEHYQNVFSNFIEQIKNYDNNNTIIVITGDLFNEKNKLDSKLVFFSKKIIYDISKLFTTFIICGNHDFIQQNRKIPDTISSVFYDSKNDDNFLYDEYNNLYYLKNTGYYIYENIGFGLLSVFDLHDLSSCGLNSDIEFPNGNILHDYFGKKEHINLALLHTTVKNSSIQTHEGYDRYLESYDNHIDVKNIENYDYILLGDIHKQQFIENAGYPSSLVQQNFGEDPINHGYILWDLKNKNYKFIRVNSDYAMIKCKISVFINNRRQKKINIDLPLFDKKLHYPKKLDLRVIIEKLEFDKYIDEKHTKDDLLKLIKEWFHDNGFTILNLEIIFETPKIENIEHNESIIDNSVDWLDIKTIEKYLKEFSNDNSLIEEYKKIHELVMIKKIKNESKNWKLISLEWSNLFSYGEDNIIDFTKDKVNIILGENFTGKSSILDVLIYTIYGSVYRCDKLLQIINVNQKLGNSSLVFQYGNIHYKIERFLKRKITKKNENHSQKIFVKKIVGNDISDIIVNLNSWTGEKLIETPEKIDDFVSEVFGTKNNFLATYILNQSNNNSFVHMKNTERKELLESWLQLDLLVDSRKFIKSSKKEKEDEYNKYKGGLEQCVKLFENMKKLFDYEHYQNNIQELNKNIDILNNDIKEFEEFELISTPVEPCVYFNDKKYKEDFIKLIDKYNEQLNDIKSKIEYVEYDQTLHDKKISEYDIITKDEDNLSTKIKTLQLKLKNYDTKNTCEENITKTSYCIDEVIENLEKNVEYYMNEINLQADEFFKDKNNYIPHNMSKKYYLEFMVDYDKFNSDYPDISNINEKLNQLKYKRENYVKLNNKKNDISTNIKLLEQKLKTINYSYIHNIENIDIHINYTNNELEMFWKAITKNCNILKLNVNKTDTNFINQYYENILEEIENWENEQNINMQNYKNIISLDKCKEDKLKYEKLNTELKNIENNLKTLSKFKFSKTCQCCSENMDILKLNKYKTTKQELLKDITILNDIYQNYDNLIVNMNLSEKYEIWKSEYTKNKLKYDKLKQDHKTYLEIKRLFNIYLKLKEKLKFFNDEKENVKFYNENIKMKEQIRILKYEYDTIIIEDDISQISDDILFYENIIQKYNKLNKEYQNWEKYVNKFDIYEEMQEKQQNNIQIRSKISEIQIQIEKLKKYNEYLELMKKYEELNNELSLLKNDKTQLNNIISNLQKIKEKFLKNKEYQQKIVDLNNDIQIMNMKWNEYINNLEIYKIKFDEYLVLKKEYDILKLKYDDSKNRIIQYKVQYDLLKDKYTQYLEIENEINIKTNELFEINKLMSIYSKLNELLSINGYNYWIYKNIIPILNNHTNNILNNIVDFTCDIELISDSIKSTSIDIYIQNANNNIKLPIKMASGFQQQIVSIAIRIALINLSNNKGSSIFMDESFSSFDINYQSKIPELLKYFSKTFDNIWVISHIENLQKDIEGKYIVKRIGLYSKVNKV
jgi:DNA repair exonuclease SbcCD ATPase subunit